MKIRNLRKELQEVIEESLQGVGFSPDYREAVMKHAELNELKGYGFTYEVTDEVDLLCNTLGDMEHDCVQSHNAAEGDGDEIVLVMPYGTITATPDEFDEMHTMFQKLLTRKFKATYKEI